MGKICSKCGIEIKSKQKGRSLATEHKKCPLSEEEHLALKPNKYAANFPPYPNKLDNGAGSKSLPVLNRSLEANFERRFSGEEPKTAFFR